MNDNMKLKYPKKSSEYLRKIEYSTDYLQTWQKIPDKYKLDLLPTLIKKYAFYGSESETNTKSSEFIGNIWGSTPSKVQKKSFKAVIPCFIEDDGNNKMAEMENLDILLFATINKSIISNSMEQILNYIKSLGIINEDEVYRKLYSYLPKTTNYNFLNILKINQRKSIIKLDKNGAKKLSNKLSNKVPIILEIKNASELSNNEITEFLNNGVNLQYIHLKDETNELAVPYDLKTYMACRKKIDDIIKNVGYTVNQKELFVKVSKEISKIHYFPMDERIAKNKDSSNFDLSNKYKYNRTYNSCSNLEGLITGNAICGGYVEIMNNIMACCGIKCIGVPGKRSLEVNHIWNQVNLDGEWYNADITYDAMNIERENKAYWLLRSDKDFVTDIDGKTPYNIHEPSIYFIDKINVCPKSVPYSEINFYLNNFSSTSSNKKNKNSSRIKDIFLEHDQRAK